MSRGKKACVHILYALRSGGGECVIQTYTEEGDYCIPLTKGSSLENSSVLRLPFRISARDRYYTLTDYFLSIPSLICLLAWMAWNRKENNYVLHGFPFQFLSLLLGRMMKLDLVFHQDKRISTEEREEKRKGIKQRVERYAFTWLPRSVRVWGVSDWVCTGLKELGAKDAKEIRIPIRMDIVNVKRSEENSTFRFVYGARFEEAKGHKRMIETLAEYETPAWREAELVLCGAGRNEREIRKYALKLKYLRVIFTGCIPRYSYLELIAEADAYLFPSHKEAFPLSLFEAIVLCDKVYVWDDELREHYRGMALAPRELKILEGDTKVNKDDWMANRKFLLYRHRPRAFYDDPEGTGANQGMEES